MGALLTKKTWNISTFNNTDRTQVHQIQCTLVQWISTIHPFIWQSGKAKAGGYREQNSDSKGVGEYLGSRWECFGVMEFYVLRTPVIVRQHICQNTYTYHENTSAAICTFKNEM